MGKQTQVKMELHCCELPMSHLIHLLEETSRLFITDTRQAKGIFVVRAIVRNVIKVKIEVKGGLWGWGEG